MGYDILNTENRHLQGGLNAKELNNPVFLFSDHCFQKCFFAAFVLRIADGNTFLLIYSKLISEAITMHTSAFKVLQCLSVMIHGCSWAQLYYVSCFLIGQLTFQHHLIC